VPARREVVLVEYLNPFCAHCRATHERLERVLARFDAPVRRRRVHVWSSDRPPAWAAACACAEPHGLSGALFDALLEEDRDGPQAVRNAARRVGLDPRALEACADAPETQARLARDRQALLAARLQGLPTLDIGRRRLMGEQSEDELLDALRAAAAE
jgi:predicted DsbA family dithiol-disulfide isomerase